MATNKTLKTRFYEKVLLPNEDGCMLWLASVTADGHGMLSIAGGRMRGAHRYSYILHNGSIPTGLQVNHTCDVARCVAPRHLYVGTQRENVRDKFERHRDWQSARVGCPNGHPYNEENTGIRKSGIGKGERYCRVCQREAARLMRAKGKVIA